MAPNPTFSLRAHSGSRSLAGGLILLVSLSGCAHFGRSPSAPPAAPTAPTTPVAGPTSGAVEAAPTSSPSATSPKRDVPAAASPQAKPNNASAAKPRSGNAGTPATPKAASAAPKGAAPDKGPAGPAASALPTLSLSDIEQRLRDTHAIGVFTKLSLKNQIDDLLGQFRAYHLKQTSTSLPQLRQRYDVLLQKVTDLLQSGDAPLARDIFSSREAIWSILTDPTKISQL
jgi:hypothetical protein